MHHKMDQDAPNTALQKQLIFNTIFEQPFDAKMLPKWNPNYLMHVYFTSLLSSPLKGTEMTPK